MTKAAGKVECPSCSTVFLATDHRHVRLGSCERCGTEFETIQPRTRFCSDRCRYDAYNEARRSNRPTGRPRKQP